MTIDNHESAQPCGCDKGANWTCEQHRTAISEAMELQREHNRLVSLHLEEIIHQPSCDSCFFCDHLLTPDDTYECPKCGWKIKHTETP